MPKRLLIVDDFPVFRAGLKSMLSEVAGLTVVGEAESGKAALTMAGELKPDLVIMDLNMPFMHGTEAIRLLKQNHPEIKMLALAEQDSPNYLEAAIHAGADGYILKDDTISNLLHAIESVLEGYMYLSAGGVYKAISDSPQTARGAGEKKVSWRDIMPFRAH